MITALAGGTGAAKFLRGLAALIELDQLTVIGNTGDDIELWGLYISPDLDTVTYTLAGLIDDAKGWGIRDDSFQCLRAMASFGRETWFALGDRDLATHLVRTESLARGLSLSSATDAIRRALGVRSLILPMSDLRVRTKISTPGGWLTFQEFFVREKARVEVLDTVYEGAETARPAPGVLEAIREARVVVLCPSNPITSIGPILAVPGIMEALAETPATVVAISPIVAGAAVSGPAGALMAARGLPVSAAGVAQIYQEWLDVLVIDRRDQGLASELQALGVSPVIADTLMSNRRQEVGLARTILGVLAPCR